jgi:hypothetical protein
MDPNSNPRIWPSLAGLLVCGCAIPATRVAVPTESMHEALQQARSIHRLEPNLEVPLHRSALSAGPPGAPRPVLAPPDIRMAYLYEWVDAEGNKHFGGWVAIPLAGFDWVMTDGSNVGLDARARTSEPDPEQR